MAAEPVEHFQVKGARRGEFLAVNPVIASHRSRRCVRNFRGKGVKTAARPHQLGLDDPAKRQRREQRREQRADVRISGGAAAEHEAVHRAGLDDGIEHARELEDHRRNNGAEKIRGRGRGADAEETAAAGLRGTQRVGTIEPR